MFCIEGQWGCGAKVVRGGNTAHGISGPSLNECKVPYKPWKSSLNPSQSISLDVKHELSHTMIHKDGEVSGLQVKRVHGQSDVLPQISRSLLGYL